MTPSNACFEGVSLRPCVFIGLRCLLPEADIRVEVFCKKRCSYRFCKIRRKIPVLESLFDKVAGLTPILKNICLLLHWRTTAFALHSHHSLLVIRYFIFSTFHVITVNISDVCFWFKFKSLQSKKFGRKKVHICK